MQYAGTSRAQPEECHQWALDDIKILESRCSFINQHKAPWLLIFRGNYCCPWLNHNQYGGLLQNNYLQLRFYEEKNWLNVRLRRLQWKWYSCTRILHFSQHLAKTWRSIWGEGCWQSIYWLSATRGWRTFSKHKENSETRSTLYNYLYYLFTSSYVSSLSFSSKSVAFFAVILCDATA